MHRTLAAGLLFGYVGCGNALAIPGAVPGPPSTAALRLYSRGSLIACSAAADAADDAASAASAARRSPESQHLINCMSNVVDEMLDGLVLTNPGLRRLKDYKVRAERTPRRIG